ncbi:hypothetical protein [Bathymodiolus japonicus methanotrophic gill symbiont]|uniref:hypothetical protein n=1 Tax=Bathymodiolus japonicus methanotrophic gill symbiont TaxID=113269 RepID=UPI001C8D463E|nr:hypothetical protein [Bathymodiolus japonicus methanotrophic gill symbiont]
MATSNGSTAIRDKILASLARYRALRIGKFPCAFWRLSARPGLTAEAYSVYENKGIKFNVVDYRDPETGKLHRFVTTLPMTINPGTIAMLYFKRWTIEKTFNNTKTRCSSFSIPLPSNSYLHPAEQYFNDAVGPKRPKSLPIICFPDGIS